ncbi:internalin-related protein [Porphyromonas crevioricanis JCM 15906]|uniref:Internalin-J n=2 Tax=Porphyromonas crevioricanis TaxID=393921 RepID=A0A2X4PY19_9PORP|nr:leucine-rich repeat domain-containing protein [Porphyromonas crevioricanis]KGN95323.1 hypothetical protein HQ38_03250 [Porphyromonas crevioricanis]SJZ60176.1 hypothetical protein SAMN02745203_00268 [Porphyromonas crevioricanis]SQH72777.1 Internalin-J precursor [Porphyromonas crevioricanis]GAD05652.1 internalin-related protein [Porphyromonas crevioricanis JCM 15906]GAD06538.1 internalin-related protein [Porphyromonas crevioricanis JCM 13913]
MNTNSKLRYLFLSIGLVSCLLQGIFVLSAQESQAVIKLWTRKEIGTTLDLTIEHGEGTEIKVEGAEKNLFNSGYYTIKDKEIRIVGPVHRLFCFENQLDSVDISGSSVIEYLGCSNNRMKKLIIGEANASMKTLHCYGNELRSLDLEKLPNLEFLNCYYNYLSDLDLTPCSKLKFVAVFGCFIKGDKAEKFINSMPTCGILTPGLFFAVNILNATHNETNVFYKDLIDKAKAKNWLVKDFAMGANEYNGIDYEGEPNPISLFPTEKRLFVVKLDKSSNRCYIEGARPNTVGAILGMDGSCIKVFSIDNEGRAVIELDSLSSGTYLIHIDRREVSKFVL